MVPTSDFSGLTSCAWALARAAAIVPIVSLERCMTTAFRLKKIKANRAGFGALSADAMADCFFGVLRHQCFQFGLGPLMLQKGLSGAAEYTRKLRPRIRRAHVDNP